MDLSRKGREMTRRAPGPLRRDSEKEREYTGGEPPGGGGGQFELHTGCPAPGVQQREDKLPQLVEKPGGLMERLGNPGLST